MATITYATFWQRFWAGWIDHLLLFAIFYVEYWIHPSSRPTAILCEFGFVTAGLAYPIYCHGRCGQTIGKRLLQVRVLRLDGGSIGWPEAWRRSAVDVACAALYLMSWLLALSAISDPQFFVDPMQRALNLKSLLPGWANWLDVAVLVWSGSELVVMLLNKRRRALHDYIAGTIVVSERSAAAQACMA